MSFGRARHRRVTRAEREELTRRIMSEIAALLEAERELSARSPAERAPRDRLRHHTSAQALVRAFLARSGSCRRGVHSSLAFDRRLWPYDLEGSAAWAGRSTGRS